MRFEEEGLFVGLVKFPFHIDGGCLFRDIFEGFFRDQHRRDYLNHLSFLQPDSSLYSPRAYRMFGSHGLAILSLIDEYAFCSRIFNTGHIKVKEGNEDINQYKTVVLTGSSERFLGEEKDYLRSRAEDTFLREPRLKKRYPFIGIIRIKFVYQYLHDFGTDFLGTIKRFIDGLKKEASDGHPLESIIVDTYDNDELMVVAFSDSLHTLDSYMKSIRMIIWKGDHPSIKPCLMGEVRHVCSSCHMSYGYDIDFSFEKEREDFLSWDWKEDCSSYSINCLIESKPGHRQELYNYVNTWHSASGKRLAESKGDLEFRRTVTGGSILHIPIPIRQIGLLHELTPTLELREHARRIKLTLNNSRKSEGKCRRRHPHPESTLNPIDSIMIETVRSDLLKLGVSKIVRERLLSLLDLYNDCTRNHLQTYYFKRLYPSVQNILFILKDFLANEEASLMEIEQKLNEEITALETAFYNRMHNKMSPNAVLEYGGGIQQFLQAFGFAYKEIIRLLAPEQAATNYSLIAGVSKESSMRTHTELNINHIIYPQLFCVTSWKEASNSTLHIFDKKEGLTDETEDLQGYFDCFRDFIQNKEAFETIIDLVLNNTDLVRTDAVYQCLRSRLLPKVLQYSLQDYIVYHFAFQRDFRLMWWYYLKVFLQTPSVYRRRGEVGRQIFIFHLLRLLLVAHREMNPQRKEFIQSFIAEQRKTPFDYLFSNLWFECFDKVNKVADQMCYHMQSYAYAHVSEHLVMYSEFYLLRPHANGDDGVARYLLMALPPDDGSHKKDELGPILTRLETILAIRKEKIDKMVEQIQEESFDPGGEMTNEETPDNTICLMNAFLRAIDLLDRGEDKRDILLHSVPRRQEDGDVDFDAVKSLSSVSARLLADPIGGFIVPDPAVRKQYYAFRTLLYRTLWDWSYRSNALIYQMFAKPENHGKSNQEAH